MRLRLSGAAAVAQDVDLHGQLIHSVLEEELALRRREVPPGLCRDGSRLVAAGGRCAGGTLRARHGDRHTSARGREEDLGALETQLTGRRPEARRDARFRVSLAAAAAGPQGLLLVGSIASLLIRLLRLRVRPAARLYMLRDARHHPAAPGSAGSGPGKPASLGGVGRNEQRGEQQECHQGFPPLNQIRSVPLKNEDHPHVREEGE
mmetsp:Transcript_51544/g.167274  ORF Transcript_51544/g.167274 Transcript_51544/m.167274 type:complete len:206 (+) Transcript_51544:972-1589(+)